MKTKRSVLFESLHKEYFPMVMQMCLGFSQGDSDKANDLTQEIFLKIWKHLESFRGKSSYKTWIYQITVNTCLQLIRNEGQIADVFTPGMYSLTTQNLPVLSTLKGWKYGFDSPFKAEVYFVSTRNITDQKWGTKNPITLNDLRFGMLEIRAFGTYVIRVKDAPVFLKEIVGTDGHFTTEEISNQLRSLIITQFTDAAGEAKLPIENYASNLNEISKYVQEIIAPEFEKYGLEVTSFFIENISMPPEIKEEIFELSRINAIDLDKLAKLKAAKALEKAAENDGGTAGAGMGMGMGFAMANQMSGSFSGKQNRGTTPPPLPNTPRHYFVALKGEQVGPFAMNVLKEMVLRNELTRETLVWREGMENWASAGQLNELSVLFGSVPPPIPK